MEGSNRLHRLSQEIHERAARLGALLDAWAIDRAAGRPIPARLPEAVHALRALLGFANDVHARRLGLPGGVHVAVMVIDGLVDDELIHHFVLAPLTRAPKRARTPEAVEQWLLNRGLQGTQLRPAGNLGDLARELHRGSAVVLVDGLPRALIVDLSGFEHRLPEELASEVVTRGPREGFTEVLRTNVAAVRRRLADHRLRVESFTAGRLSHSRGALLYVLGRADPLVVERVRRCLSSVALDVVVDTSQLVAYLSNRPWSPFLQYRSTERPEVCAAALAEGQVVVMLDGTPFAVIAPSTFWDLLHSPDDYYLRWPFASAIRLLRLAAALFSVGGLALYVAVVNYHHELVPTNLLVTIVTSRAAVPYPTLMEALILNLGFDLLREAGARMPRGIGGALTVVGALVVGDAMVRGGLASAPMIVLVAVSAVATLALPTFAVTVPFRLLSYGLLVLGSTLGLFGVAVGATVIAGHLASLESAGKPFLAPLAPWRGKALLEDAITRLPWSLHRLPVPFLSRQGARDQADRGQAPPGGAKA
ncbi:spore germination protein [Hydrogenibacillus sp. N12]|uniref:spore germination protein n=1 Tax=Hydrogenibacillus sp. N12 TaxID=2866627 RepID=UPI001C7D8486|nr:spore germination protein [Hydrogenibacillus sp. N12]QZA32160.1 spore germination protein [Hydrogenibacillus sp. N12]